MNSEVLLHEQVQGCRCKSPIGWAWFMCSWARVLAALWGGQGEWISDFHGFSTGVGESFFYSRLTQYLSFQTWEEMLLLSTHTSSKIPKTSASESAHPKPISFSFFFFCFISEVQFSSVRFSCSVVSDSLRPHESQHARPPCPSPTPRACSNSCPSSGWCHPLCVHVYKCGTVHRDRSRVAPAALSRQPRHFQATGKEPLHLLWQSRTSRPLSCDLLQ